MKIKHYPGKAVINDPAWLEMDISNQTRGRQYEQNWLTTQKTLSSSTNSSTTNSWDKYNEGGGGGTISSRLGQYQTMLDEIKSDESEKNSTKSTKIHKQDSIRLKYHSDKCLARINSKKLTPSEDMSFQKRTKTDNYDAVINDLTKQLKKSVRFHDKNEFVTKK